MPRLTPPVPLAAALALSVALPAAPRAGAAQTLSPATAAAVPRRALPRPDAARAATHPAVRAALAAIQRDNAWTLEQQAAVCEIPAPPFKEAARAAELQRRFRALGLQDVRTDAEGNVIAERRGRGRGPVVVLSAHLDTVFPEGTDVTVKRSGTTLTAPGIGDDCRGLAVLLAVARAMDAARVATEGTVLFVASVGEEGPGDLRGVRHLFTKEMPGRIDYFVSVDGTGLDVTSRAVGSARYRVTYKGPGGHSYGAFGMPNPIHAMGRAIARIGDIQVPTAPRTTFNVGVVSGGTSVNSISATGTMDVDLRSESQAELDTLDARFRRAVDAALAEENARWPGSRVRLTVDIAPIGKRPAGAQPDSAPIVRAALEAARTLGAAPEIGASSTDANIPISLGIPAITIDGGGKGSGAHSLGESYDDAGRGYLGPQWAAIIVSALAGVK